LSWVERLRQVIVRAELEPDNAIDIVAARGQHDHGDVAAPANPLQHLEPAEAGKHDVEDQKVESFAGELLQALFAARGDGKVEPFPGEVVAQHAAELPVVVDKQDPCVAVLNLLFQLLHCDLAVDASSMKDTARATQP